MATVAVIDYGMGNLHSISKALKKVSPASNVIVSADKEVILSADHVVFPGVGAIRDCMAAIHDAGLDETIKQVAQSKPLLGICIGMQALLEHSEENGGVDCLGVIPGNVIKFPLNLKNKQNEKLKIPHMGWNEVNYSKKSPLFNNIDNNERFYFVHSYHASKVGNNCEIASTQYPKPFPCAIKWKNVVAVQFHPEKSQHAGLQLLKNFLNWDGQS
ncbi:MAG: imidazole glycerol phosphate synthase subunit HisH [Piscirickettsiaceae bacterium]|nr:MAG: imidazole glycerol phosphate synthase subunit HisH [Piscirickettsiaceae bacterium]PCI69959.1 MAG: imidazole glycerol phosphate synthase subunit HisH [Piscirickettsiaceae bacterium]